MPSFFRLLNDLEFYFFQLYPVKFVLLTFFVEHIRSRNNTYFFFFKYSALGFLASL